MRPPGLHEAYMQSVCIYPAYVFLSASIFALQLELGCGSLLAHSIPPQYVHQLSRLLLLCLFFACWEQVHLQAIRQLD